MILYLLLCGTGILSVLLTRMAWRRHRQDMRRLRRAERGKA